MRVAPGTLKRLLQKQALPACGEEQRVDRANQEAHAKRLVTAVAQPHIHAESISARGGLKRLREVAKHHQARCVDARTRLGEPQLHGGKFTHAAVAACHHTASGAYARHRQKIGERAFRNTEHRRHDGDR